MPIRDKEIERLKRELKANETLMREAAIRYEDLIAAKESLKKALEERRNSKKKEPVSK